MDEKVNCRVLKEANGNRFVFTVDGTNRCVGEIFVAADTRYLQTVLSMFNKAAGMMMNRAPLPASIRDIINGKGAKYG